MKIPKEEYFRKELYILLSIGWFVTAIISFVAILTLPSFYNIITIIFIHIICVIFWYFWVLFDARNQYIEKELEKALKNNGTKEQKYIYAYDPTIKRVVLHLVRGVNAISLITQNKIKYKPKRSPTKRWSI